MARRGRPRIKIPENTSDKPSSIRRSQASVKRLKSREGYISNPNDRAEMLYRKGNEPKSGTRAKPKVVTAKNKATISSTMRKPLGRPKVGPRKRSSGGARAT